MQSAIAPRVDINEDEADCEIIAELSGVKKEIIHALITTNLAAKYSGSYGGRCKLWVSYTNIASIRAEESYLAKGISLNG